MKEHDDAREIEMVGGEDHFVVQVEGQIEDKVTSNEEAKDKEGGLLFGGGHGGHGSGRWYGRGCQSMGWWGVGTCRKRKEKGGKEGRNLHKIPSDKKADFAGTRVKMVKSTFATVM